MPISFPRGHSPGPPISPSSCTLPCSSKDIGSVKGISTACARAPARNLFRPLNNLGRTGRSTLPTICLRVVFERLQYRLSIMRRELGKRSESCLDGDIKKFQIFNVAFLHTPREKLSFRALALASLRSTTICTSSSIIRRPSITLSCVGAR